MKKKLLVLMMAAVMALGAVAMCFAEDVFITKSGKVYHHAESPFIQNRETVKMTKEEAEAKGYKPSKSYLKHLADQSAQAQAQGKK
jgi:hypothetical protein